MVFSCRANTLSNFFATVFDLTQFINTANYNKNGHAKIRTN